MAEETKDNKDFDKERQRADQEASNAARARETASTLSSENATLKGDMAAMQTRLNQIDSDSAAAKAIDSVLSDIDPNDASAEDLASVAVETKKVITTLAQDVATLKSSTAKSDAEREREKQAEESEARDNAVLNDVCNDFETEFGAGLRNKAIALMEKTNKEKGLAVNPAKALLRLRDCFKQVSEVKDDDTGDPHFTDTGGGGGRPFVTSPEIKEGSLDDVAAQYKKHATG